MLLNADQLIKTKYVQVITYQ